MTASGNPTEQATPVARVPPPGGLFRARVLLVLGLLGLIVVLVFILQNFQDVKVSFFAAHWRAPLAVSLLFAAVLGGLIVFGVESIRLMRSRKTAKNQAKQVQQAQRAQKAQKASAAPNG